MPSEILLPTTVLADGGWSDPEGALAEGGAYASTDSIGAWLFVGGWDLGELPEGWQPTGFEVLLRCQYPAAYPIEWIPRLELCLTVDGVAVHGASKIVEIPNGLAWNDLLAGAFDDLWGSAWSAGDVEGASFGVGVRLPTEDEPVDPLLDETRWVDEIVLVVHYTYGEGVMPGERSTVLQGARLGPESSFGAGGSANISLRSFNVDLAPNPEVSKIRATGYKVPVGQRFEREWAGVSIEGSPCYNELGYPLAMLDTPTTAVIVASTVYRHTWIPNVRGCTSPKSHQIEKGDGCSVQYEAVLAAVLQELGLSYESGSISFNGSGFSRAVNIAPTPTAGANEVQTVTLSGTPTGGDFKLEFDGAVTATIAYNAAAATVQTALQALSTIGSGNATVSGSAGGPWTVTFAGDLAGLAQPLLALADNDLTGGTSPSVSFAKTTNGGYTERPLAFIQAGQGKSYLHTTMAGVLDEANLVTKLDNASIGLNSGIQPQWLAGSNAIGGFLEGEADYGAEIAVQADTAGKGLLTQLRNGTRVYWRTRFTGDVIGSGEPYFLDVFLCGRVEEFQGFGDEDGMYGAKFKIGAEWDETQGFAVKVILQNRVASY